MEADHRGEMAMEYGLHDISEGDGSGFFHALVVDDEGIIRDLLKAMLTGMRVLVDVAENGLEAQKKIVAGAYELVITDINMPEMDGIALLKWLGEEWPDIEVVVMTGYEMTDEMLQVIGKIAMDCFSKPPDAKKIEAVVRYCREKIRIQGNA